VKLRHFEALHPVCPVCKSRLQEDFPLKLGLEIRRDGERIIEGVLQCPNDACLYEYPILDGIPILAPDPRAYVADSIFHLLARSDLSNEVESMLGECCGPGSTLDATRQQLSNYAWDHYGELDPGESREGPRPGAVVQVLERGVSLAENKLEGPVLDVGCSVGRSTFELAERGDELVLGIDLNFSMLRLAAEVLESQTVRYPRRRVGLIYDRRQFAARFDHSANVDFWACDAMALPFPSNTFGTAVSLNLLDCVHSPLAMLHSLRDALHPGAHLLLASPYDWSGSTLPDTWIGGHSRRSLGQGSSEPVLRALLTPGGHPVAVEGLEIVAEADDVPWHVRVHDRNVATYRLHLVVARATETPPHSQDLDQ
jgi:SAM-dependent methyltransferase/uncharacterized protein YbaR (Trm112 family)